MNYAQAKQTFINALPEDPPTPPGQRQRPRVTNAEARWHRHMVETVCGSASFPACDDAPATIEWSESMSAHATIGGGVIVEKRGGLPASEAAAHNREWVLVVWSSPRVGALTVEEAFKLGLNETVWPGIERKPAAQTA